MERWIYERSGCHFIAVTGMHGVMEAQYDPSFKHVLNTADVVVPDGMSLVWLGRWLRYANVKRRVYGPELMETFCRETGAKYRHFLYGGAPGVPEHLRECLQLKYGLSVVGTYSPPFHPLTPEEDADIVALINQVHLDLLWVGLSTPKQEWWIYEHRKKLQVPVMVGVGAAFDFLAGLKPQAPYWMQENGLEWLFRLITEPRRLWRRVLIYGPKFLYYVMLEQLRLKKFN